MGAFEVKAEEAGHRRLARGKAGGDGPFRDLAIVGDQRRQERGRTDAGMGGADGADAFEIWLLVEQHAATAIDLQVDEAGDEREPVHRHSAGIARHVA